MRARGEMAWVHVDVLIIIFAPRGGRSKRAQGYDRANRDEADYVSLLKRVLDSRCRRF